MKKLLLAGVATLAVVGAANAADLYTKARPMVAPVAPPPPAFSWSGCFVGAHWGWGWGRKDVHESEFTSDEAFAASGRIDTSGPIFGGQVGCDYQFGFGKGVGFGPGGWVIGIQFDGAGTDINGFRTDPFGAAFFNFGVFDRIEVKQELLASLTGRLGFAGGGGGFWSQTLWYVRGGVAWTRDRWDLTGANDFFLDSNTAVSSPVTQNRTGWTVGVGWEWAFMPNWSVFLEWNHYDFGTDTLLTTSFGDLTDRFESKQRVETFKVGVNWRFNLLGFGKGKAPVVASY